MDVALQALRSGDSAAWSAIYEELADRVYQYALFRVDGNRETAEVITQEVFVRAFEFIDSYDPQKGTLLGWFRGICRRAIAKWYRDIPRKPIQAVPISSCPEGSGHCSEPVDIRPRPDEQLILADEQLLTGAALTSLPYRWEQVLRWKYCEEMSVGAIAAQLGSSEKAIESLLSRARIAFRQVYARLVNSEPANLHEVEDLDE